MAAEQGERIVKSLNFLDDIRTGKGQRLHEDSLKAVFELLNGKKADFVYDQIEIAEDINADLTEMISNELTFCSTDKAKAIYPAQLSETDRSNLFAAAFILYGIALAENKKRM